MALAFSCIQIVLVKLVLKIGHHAIIQVSRKAIPNTNSNNSVMIKITIYKQDPLS